MDQSESTKITQNQFNHYLILVGHIFDLDRSRTGTSDPSVLAIQSYNGQIVQSHASRSNGWDEHRNKKKKRKKKLVDQ